MIDSLPSRASVIERSGARCEAMVKLPRAWTRCGKGPVEVHHALTRARGGALLDSVGETYHLIALCNTHHREVDDHGHSSGLMIRGSVYRHGLHLIYEGPDEYLRAAYGKAAARHTAAVGLSVVS